MAIHINQHVPILQRRQVLKQVERARVAGLHHVKDHHAAVKLMGKLMLDAQRLQLRADQLAPERAPVYVKAALRARVAAAKRRSQHAGHHQHVLRARRVRRTGQHNRRLLDRQLELILHAANDARLPLRCVRLPLRNRHRYGQPAQRPLKLLQQMLINQKALPFTRSFSECSFIIAQLSPAAKRKKGFKSNFFVKFQQNRIVTGNDCRV